MRKQIFSHFAVALVVGILAFLAFREPTVDAQTDTLRPGISSGGSTDAQSVEPTVLRKMRHREGTRLKDKHVQFRITGNRITMYLEGENAERYVCLENVNLERIMKVIRENPLQQVWSVDGVITEFQGENYFLVQKSILAPNVIVQKP